MESRESQAIKKAGSAPNEERQTRPQCEPHVERPEMHRDFQGFALENEGIFYFGMPLAGCGGLWYSDFVGIWHGCVNASWVVLTTQLIPARGRKRNVFGEVRHGHTTQLIPARGRKPMMLAADQTRKMTQLIPARGRKLIHAKFASKDRRHNLSPQGDGNLCEAADRTWPRDTTYPRKGTETASFPKWLEFQKGHNLSPQGDEEGNTRAPSTTL